MQMHRARQAPDGLYLWTALAAPRSGMKDQQKAKSRSVSGSRQIS